MTRQEKLENIKMVARKAYKEEQSINHEAFGANELMRSFGDPNLGDQVQMETYRLNGVIAGLFREEPENDPDPQDLLGSKVKMETEEMDRIEDGIRAVFDPEKVVMDMMQGKGNVTPETMDVLRVAHPEFVGKLRQEILVGLNSGMVNLKHSQLVDFSMLLDTPLEKSMGYEDQITLDQLYRAQEGRRQNMINRGLKMQEPVDMRTAYDKREVNL